MGSYNTSCFVTKQTISSGDRCQVLPIVQASSYTPMTLRHADKTYTEYSYGNSACYSSRHWEPVTYFLEATYEDRCETKLADTKVNRHRLLSFMKEALRNIPAIETSDQSRRDRGFNFAEYMASVAPELKAYLEAKAPAPDVNRDVLFAQCQECFHQLQEQAQQHSLFWRASNGAMRPLSFAAMHGATFDALVEMRARSSDIEGNSMDLRAFFNRALHDARQARSTAMEEEIEDQGINKDLLVEMATLDAFKESFERTGADMNFRNPSEMMAARYGVRALFKGQLTEDQLFESLKPGLESQYACAGIDRVNAHFEPMVYAGQDYSNTIGKAYAQLVDRVSERVSYENDVRNFGEPRRYVLEIHDQAVLTDLAVIAKDADHSWRVANVQPPAIAGGPHTIELLTTMQLKRLQTVLLDYEAEEGNAGRLDINTLQAMDENGQPLDAGRGMRP